MRPKPLVLAIIDGWGVAADSAGNAITQALTPNFAKLISEYPAVSLNASQEEVGLSVGEPGNPQAGHLNIGAGRIYYDILPKINESIKSGSIKKKHAFVDCFEHAQKNKSALHLVGLISQSDVDASREHCYALLNLAKDYDLKKVLVHVILDGVEANHNSGLIVIKELQEKIKEIGIGKIATISGHNYGMDRNFHWDRTKKSYQAIALGVSEESFKDPVEAIESSYAKEIFDDRLVPTVILNKVGAPLSEVNEDDAIIFFNHRPDGLRQLAKSFIFPDYKFPSPRIPNLFCLTMSVYEKNIPAVAAYQPLVVHNSLAEVISKAGLKQLHIADTHRFAEATYFLNGLTDLSFPGETRKNLVAPECFSCTDTPDLSIDKITHHLLEVLYKDLYDVIFVDYSNVDVLAASGNIEATKLAVQSLDKNFGKLVDHVLAKSGVVILTSSHGRAEEMIDLHTGENKTGDNFNPVPFVVIGDQFRGMASPSGDLLEGDLSLIKPAGSLCDVAPTILKILELEPPEKMTGRTLI